MHTPVIGAARYIGQRVHRKEDPRLLTGRGQFVDDVSLPGMLHCAFVRSTIARGRIVSIDCAEAQRLPGVRAVYTADDLARRKLEMLSLFMNPLEVPTGVLADGRVSYVGDPIALVIADRRNIAEDAVALVQVEYAEEEPVVIACRCPERSAGPPRNRDQHSRLDGRVAASAGPGRAARWRAA